MNAAKSFMTWLVLLANLLLMAALSLHVVRGTTGWAVVPKEHLTLLDTWVDSREWSPSDTENHPALFHSLKVYNLTDRVPSAAPAGSQASADQTTTVTRSAAALPAVRETKPAESPRVATGSVQAPVRKESPAAKPAANNIFDEMDDSHK